MEESGGDQGGGAAARAHGRTSARAHACMHARAHLDLAVDGRHLRVELRPVGRVGGGCERLLRARPLLVHGAADLKVALKRPLLEGVGLVGADVEDELVAVEEVVHLVDDAEDVLAMGAHLCRARST